MIKKFFFFLFLLITFSSFILGQPPFQTSEDNGGELTIIFPKTEIFNIDDDIKMHFHIFNSTGYVINASDVSCRIHIYDKDGSHLLDYELIDGTETTVTVDKELYLTKANFSGTGEYGYTTWCNATNNEAGFFSGVIQITNNGEEVNNNWLPLLIIFIIVMISSFYISKDIKVNEKSKKAHQSVMLFVKTFYYYYGILHIIFISILALLMTISKNISNYQDIMIMYFIVNISIAVFYVWFKSWELGLKSLEEMFSDRK